MPCILYRENVGVTSLNYFKILRKKHFEPPRNCIINIAQQMFQNITSPTLVCSGILNVLLNKTEDFMKLCVYYCKIKCLIF